MDWYSIGVSAVSGAVAGGIGWLVSMRISDKKKRPIIAAAVTIVLFTVIYVWAKYTFIAEHRVQVEMAAFDSGVEENPAFESIQEFAPEVMTEIREYIRTATNEGHSVLEAETNSRAIIAQLIASRMPKSSDAALLNAVELTIDQMSWLQQHDDDSCFKFLHPHVAGGISANDVLSKELRDRDNESTRLILSTYDESRSIPTPGQAEPLVTPIYSTLFDKFGQATVAQLADVGAPGVDRAEVCAVTIEFFNEIVALPQDDAVTVLRWMFAGA